jgi:hypothetical protein
VNKVFLPCSKHYVLMYENGTMRAVENSRNGGRRDEGEWWRG